MIGSRIGRLLSLLGLASGCHLFVAHTPAPDQGPFDLAADRHSPPPGDRSRADVVLGAFGPAIKVGEGVVSTAEQEDDPTLTGDMLEIYFERHQDIYRAVRAAIDSPWEAATPVAELNTPSEEGTPELAPDGLTLHFSSARDGGPVHVYVATRTARGQPFGAPAPVPELSSTASDNCPTPSADGLVMALDSDRAVLGDRDLYLTRRASLTAPWSAPAAIAELNTAGTEDSSPWIDRELRVLYFASKRGGNMDLWVATRPDAGAKFGAPNQLEGINTAETDSDPWLSPDLRTLYFTRSVAGNYEIYMATR